jgi:hypothetical protein
VGRVHARLWNGGGGVGAVLGADAWEGLGGFDACLTDAVWFAVVTCVRACVLAI